MIFIYYLQYKKEESLYLCPRTGRG